MELTVISTFAGGGGSSLGYKLAGFKELLAIDFDKNAIETFKLNFDCPTWQRDIKTVTGKEILKICKIKKGDLSILDGSPPCQGFSTSGKRQVNDSRNDLFKEFVRLIDELQPKVFVMENVSGMIKGKMKGKFIEIITTLKTLNYNVKAKLMNAMYYNVPQSRQRIIFIGIHKNLNIEPSFPEPKNKLITVKKALKNIIPRTFDNHSKSAQRLWNKIKIGKNGFNRLNKQTHYNYLKIDPNKPAPTLLKSVCYNGFGYYHWNENRSLSIEELKAICSYPQSFELSGNVNEQFGILGNSVMPKFMQAIAEHIKDNILNRIN